MLPDERERMCVAEHDSVVPSEAERVAGEAGWRKARTCVHAYPSTGDDVRVGRRVCWVWRVVALLGSGKQERENLLSGDEYGNRVSVSGGVELGRGVDVVIRFRDCSLGMTIATTLSWTLKELRWLMEGRRVLAGMDRHPSRLNGLLHHPQSKARRTSDPPDTQ